MSTTINSVFSIWSNLEQSYEKIGKPKGLDKSAFFKSLVGFSNGKHRLPALLNKLNNELKNSDFKSNEEVLDKYTKLTETFKILGNHLDNNPIPNNIENLDLYLINCMGFLDNSVTGEDILKEFSYDYKEDQNIKRFYHRIMLEEFNCLTDHIVCDKSGKINHYIGVECPSDNFRFFTKEMSYPYLKNCYSSKESLENKFNLDCATTIAILAKLGKIPHQYFISSKENLKDNLLFGKGEIKFVNQYSDPNINVTLVEFKHKEMSIFCLY